MSTVVVNTDHLALIDQMMKIELEKVADHRVKAHKLREALDQEEKSMRYFQQKASAYREQALLLMAERERVSAGAVEHPDFERAVVCAGAFDGVILTNVSTEREVRLRVHRGGERIADIVSHPAEQADDKKPRYSVAGWRAKDGSPASPFTTLEEALETACTMEPWTPEPVLHTYERD
jgi:hypothetical protein